jgi:hypothetical protein
MTNTDKRNLLILPIIILVRVPLLVPLWLLMKIGDGAYIVGKSIGNFLPVWK